MLREALQKIRCSTEQPWRALAIALALTFFVVAPVARGLLRQAGLTAATAATPGSLVGFGVFVLYLIYLVWRGGAEIERRRRVVELRAARQREAEYRRRVVLSRRPELWIFRTARDAELVARNWMRYFGFRDAELTKPGADGGIDVVASGAVAQVKAEAKAVGRPVVQQTFGVAQSRRKGCLVFALAGYTSPALEWAAENGVALFTFNHAGEVVPGNSIGERMLRQADEHAYAERMRLDGPETRGMIDASYEAS